MKLVTSIFLFAILSSNGLAAEWVTLTPEDLLEVQVIDTNTYHFAEEGVYIKRTSDFAYTSAVTCSKKQFVAFVTPKLADRALSAIYYSLASSKSIKFYVDGCTNAYPKATSFMLIP